LKKYIHIIFTLLVIISKGLSAQEIAKHDSVAIRENHHDAHTFLNHIALFAGITTPLEKSGSNFSLGLDYVRILNENRHWAGSVFAEAIFAEHTEWVFGVVIFHRIGEQFWIRTGPGIEIIQEEDHDSHDHATKSQVEFLYRIGCGYPFHFGSITVTPSVDLDLVRSATALVWGVNIGKSF
jgi:hypothetical protein